MAIVYITCLRVFVENKNMKLNTHLCMFVYISVIFGVKYLNMEDKVHIPKSESIIYWKIQPFNNAI